MHESTLWWGDGQGLDTVELTFSWTGFLREACGGGWLMGFSLDMLIYLGWCARLAL